MANAGKSIDFLFNQMRSYQGSLAGGSITFYSPGVTTAIVPIYLDVDLTQPAANPYTLSADGTAELFANGTYRIIVKNSFDVIVFDYDWVEIMPIPAATGGGGSGVITAVHKVIDCLNASKTVDLTTDPLQYITRIGDSANELTIVPLATKTIYNQRSTATLYSDGETMGFLYDGLVYWPLIG